MRLLGPVQPVDDLLDLYLVDREPHGDRPWVMANMVGGLDGTAAVGGRVGALSDDTDAQLFRAMRAVADIVLVGAETARLERYGPVRRTEVERHVAVGLAALAKKSASCSMLSCVASPPSP